MSGPAAATGSTHALPGTVSGRLHLTTIGGFGGGRGIVQTPRSSTSAAAEQLLHSWLSFHDRHGQVLKSMEKGSPGLGVGFGPVG